MSVASIASAVLLLVLAGAAAAAPDSAAPKPVRLHVGREVEVAADRELPSTAPSVAVDPTNPERLMVTFLAVWPGEQIETLGGVSVSEDGGATFDREGTGTLSFVSWGTDGPQVAFAPGGKPYVARTLFEDESPGTGPPVPVVVHRRDDDSDWEWMSPPSLGLGRRHPLLAIDPGSGRIYASTVQGGGDAPNAVAVHWSTNGGKKYEGPTLIAKGKDPAINLSPVVLADGTLLQFVLLTPGGGPARIEVAASEDRGRTFGDLRLVGTQELDARFASLRTLPKLAVDRSDRYRDRLYAVWTDSRSATPRVVLAKSTDRGLTWSAPKEVAASSAAGVWQFQPTVAVSDEGAMGVSWFDTRFSRDGKGHDQLFTVSLDGGETFLPPARVSRASSPFLSAGTGKPFPQVGKGEGGTTLRLDSYASRWPVGGDGMGLAARPGNVFHLVWTDGRQERYRLLAARVSLLDLPPAETMAELDVTEQVEVLAGEATYDPDKQAGTVPLRIKNLSDALLCGPLRLEAFSGEGGVIGTLDFSSVLGSSRCLTAGEISGTVNLELRYPASGPAAEVQLKVVGRVER